MCAAEKAMAPHSSVLAWRIPGMGEPGGLRSLGSHRVGHDWSDLAANVCWIQSYQFSRYKSQRAKVAFVLNSTAPQTPYRHWKQICRIIIIFTIIKIKHDIMKLITFFFFQWEREIVFNLLLRWLSKLRGAVSQGPHPNVIYYLEAHQEWWQDLIVRMFRSKVNPEMMESWLYSCSPALLSLVQMTSVQLQVTYKYVSVELNFYYFSYWDLGIIWYEKIL